MRGSEAGCSPSHLRAGHALPRRGVADPQRLKAFWQAQLLKHLSV